MGEGSTPYRQHDEREKGIEDATSTLAVQPVASIGRHRGSYHNRDGEACSVRFVGYQARQVEPHDGYGGCREHKENF